MGQIREWGDINSLSQICQQTQCDGGFRQRWTQRGRRETTQTSDKTFAESDLDSTVNLDYINFDIRKIQQIICNVNIYWTMWILMKLPIIKNTGKKPL